MVFEGEKKKDKEDEEDMRNSDESGWGTYGLDGKRGWIGERRKDIYIYIEWNKMISCVEQNGR